MSARLSISLIVIWRVAEFETRQLKSPAIEPIHFLLGLTKVVDVDLVALVTKHATNRDEVLEECLREVRRLRNVFRKANMNAATFRRRMRRALGRQSLALEESERLHRSPAARKLFIDAARVAFLSASVVYPIHLLISVLAAEDARRDGVFRELGINPERLRAEAKQELLFDQITPASPNNKAHLN